MGEHFITCNCLNLSMTSELEPPYADEGGDKKTSSQRTSNERMHELADTIRPTNNSNCEIEFIHNILEKNHCIILFAKNTPKTRN